MFLDYGRRVQGTLTNEVSLLFPVWYKQDFRELMEYIDSQFALIENEHHIKYGELLDFNF